jgi:hypothetical protein
MIGLIPLRFKIYGMIAVGIVLGLLGWRSAGIKAALEKAEAKEKERRLDQIRTAKEVEEYVESLDDNSLRQRASRWVRNKNDG